MKEQFIPYEQALALKELGFDERCLAFYNGKFLESTDYDFDNGTSKDIGLCIVAPLYQHAFKFFREKYNLFCEIQIDRTTEPKFCFDIFQYEHFGNYEKIEVKEWYLYRTQEEAELACLKKLIEIANEQHR
jgi:hypothetical protein